MPLLTGSLSSTWRLGVCALVVSCTDPRPRPVPPEVELSFSPSLVVRSPGTIAGSLYAFDADGLAEIGFEVLSEDSVMMSDTTLTPSDFIESTHSLAVPVPDGVAIGTQIRLVARATDFLGFAAADTVFLAVQDTT
jgi:hypothetical protein